VLLPDLDHNPPTYTSLVAGIIVVSYSTCLKIIPHLNKGGGEEGEGRKKERERGRENMPAKQRFWRGLFRGDKYLIKTNKNS
jgi:hypothetical protein